MALIGTERLASNLAWVGVKPPSDLPLVSEERIYALYDSESDVEALRRAQEVTRAQKEAQAKFQKQTRRVAIFTSILYGLVFGWWATAWQDNQLKFLLIGIGIFVVVLHIGLYYFVKLIYQSAAEDPSISLPIRNQIKANLPKMMNDFRNWLYISIFFKIIEVFAVATLLLLVASYITSDLGSVEQFLRMVVSGIANFYYGEQSPEAQLLAQVTTIALILGVGLVGNKGGSASLRLSQLAA